MKPAMICFMGLDGSGKSTSIEYACQQLKNRGCKVEIVRAAYVIVFLRGVIALGKKLLMKKDSDPFSGDYRAYLESLRRNADRGGVYQIFSFLTAMEFKAQILFQIRLKRWLGRTLLVDRYIYDNVVTCAANLDLGEEYMEKTMNGKWKHAPRPDKIIYIRTPVEVCFARKDDIPDPLYLEIRQPRYEAVARMYGADVISGGQDLTMVQEILCQAMDAVHKVCQENGIAYYLIGGSALGAVRHRGFIPWDVDIDIGMHRTQYEAFARIAPACLPAGYSYHDHRNTKGCYQSHAAVWVDHAKAVVDPDYYRQRREVNLLIDILPLDNAPDHVYLQERQEAEIRKLTRLQSRKECILYRRNSVWERLIQAALLPCSLERLERRREEILTRYDGQEARCWCSMLSQYPYKKQCMPREIYGRPVLMDFCGRQYYGPEQVEEYLERIFGENYRELPPPERRLRPGDRIETLILSR